MSEDFKGLRETLSSAIARLDDILSKGNESVVHCPSCFYQDNKDEPCPGPSMPVPSHYHLAQEDLSDSSCAKCGLDIRSEVHKGMSEPPQAPATERHLCRVGYPHNDRCDATCEEASGSVKLCTCHRPGECLKPPTGKREGG